MHDDSWQTYSSTLRHLLERPKLLQQFQEDLDGTATANLNISGEMRTDIKQLLLSLASYQTPPAAASAAGGQGSGESTFSAESFFESTYAHLRRAALATTLMSIVIFLVGILLLGIAAAQSITRETEAGTAIVLAASGLGAIATAFYRSPVSQVRDSAVEVQQSSMILMSYMLGLNLVSKSLSGMRMTEESVMLSALTRDLVILLRGEHPSTTGPPPEDRG